MKRLNFLTMVAVALMMGFTSCNNDDDLQGGSEDNGKQTYMTVALNFPKSDAPQLRSTSDVNATEDEAKITNVDVFIYTASGSFSSYAALSAADFTQAASGVSEDKYTYTKVTKIPTTTGAKNVFVGINLPAALVTSLSNKPMSDLMTAAQTMTRTQMATVTNGLPMFSTATVSSTFVEDPANAANNVTVRVERMVAKVTVETSATIEVAGVPGTLGNISFAINNFNTKSFLMQGAAPDYKDSNWATGSYVAGDFSQAVTGDYVSVLDRAVIATPTISQYNARYAAENTSKDKTKGEITRGTIRATFIPTNVTTDAAGTTATAASLGITVPATFWAVTPSVSSGTSYFYTKSIADAFSAANGSATVVEYSGGLCYWDMFLNKNALAAANKWDVLRNDFYKCNITRIVAPGRPTETVIDPLLPPDSETMITVNVEVEFWHTPILSDYVLEP